MPVDQALLLVIATVTIGGAICIYGFRARARRFVASQHDVKSDHQIEEYLQSAPAGAQREQIRRLIDHVRSHNGGVVRNGHLYWIVCVQEGDQPRNPVPSFAPGKKDPYRPQADVGFHIGLDAHLEMIDQGKLSDDTAKQLAQCARDGSPYAKTTLGTMLLSRKGDTTADYAVELLQSASAAGFSRAAIELGQALLEGSAIPRDIPGGLAQMERGFQLGDRRAGVFLAAARFYGPWGVPKDLAAARQWAARCAPSPFKWITRSRALSGAYLRWLLHRGQPDAGFL